MQRLLLALLALGAVLTLSLLRRGPLDAAGAVELRAVGGSAQVEPSAPATRPSGQERSRSTVHNASADGAAAVAGRVVDAAGIGLAGATVQFSGLDRATADAEGRFEVPDLAPGEYLLRPVLQGYAGPTSAPVRVAAGEVARDVVLRMERARTLAGQVRVFRRGDDAGPPVAGATVEFVGPAGEDEAVVRAATTDFRGSFLLVDVPPGPLDLVVEHAEFLPQRRRIPADSAAVELQLTPAPLVTGRVLAGAGPAEVQFVTLLASQRDEAGPWVIAGERVAVGASSGSRGEFRLVASPGRWLRVTAESRDCAPATSAPFRLAADGSCDPLTLHATDGVVVEARVVAGARAEDTTPLAGAELRFVELTGSGVRRVAGASIEQSIIVTGPDGAARSAPMHPGTYQVTVRAEGYLTRTLEAVEVTGSTTLEPVLMTGAGIIVGELVDASGGTLPELTASATSADGERHEGEVTRGAFELTGLRAGEYIVEVAATGGGAQVLASRTVEVLAGRASRVRFDPPGERGTVSGRLVIDGAPAVSAEVRLEDARQELRWSSRTDRNGRFRFTAVPAGRLVLRARTDRDEACYAARIVERVAGEDVEVDFTVDTAPLRGRVEDESSRPLRRAIVVLEQRLEHEVHTLAWLRTNSRGEFEIAQAPAGELLVTTDVDFHANVRRASLATLKGTRDRAVVVLERRGDLYFHLPERGAGAVMIDVWDAASSGEPRTTHFERAQRLRVSGLGAGEVRWSLECRDGSVRRGLAEVALGELRTVMVDR